MECGSDMDKAYGIYRVTLAVIQISCITAIPRIALHSVYP